MGVYRRPWRRRAVPRRWVGTRAGATTFTLTLSATVGMGASLIRQTGAVRACSTAIVGALVRQTGAIRSSATGMAAALVRRVGASRAAATSITAVLVRQVGAVRAATTTMLATVAPLKVILRTLSAAVGMSAALVRQSGKALAASVAMLATLPRLSGKLLAASSAQLAVVVKRPSKALAASTAMLATVAAIKVFLKTLTATVGIVCNPFYAQTILAASPVAYWRFGESSGTTATDATGNGHAGTYHGVSLGAAGAITSDSDSAANFVGGLDDVTVPDATGLHVNDTFTYEFWIKRNSVSNSVEDIYGQNATNSLLVRINATNTLSMRCFGVGDCVMSTSQALGDTNWHHVVLAKNGASSAKIYLDGVDVSGAVTNRTFTTAAATAMIGGDGAVIRLNAMLDEFAIYGSALSASDVAAHYAAGVASPGLMRQTLKALAPTTPLAASLRRSVSVTRATVLALAPAAQKRISRTLATALTIVALVTSSRSGASTAGGLIEGGGTSSIIGGDSGVSGLIGGEGGVSGITGGEGSTGLAG